MADIKLQASDRHAPSQGASIPADAARAATASNIRRKRADEAEDVIVTSGSSSEVASGPASNEAPAPAASDVETAVHDSAAGTSANAASNGLAIAGGLGVIGLIGAAAVGGGGHASSPVQALARHQEPLLPQPQPPDPTTPDEPRARIPKPDMSRPDTPHVDAPHVDAPTADTTGPDITTPNVTAPEPSVADAKPAEPSHPVAPATPVPDRTAPVPPTLSLKHDTGADATDGITSDSTITVDGLEPDATWRYRLDDGKTWHAGSGSELSTAPFDGAHQVRVIQTDKAGNDSDPAVFQFTLDTGAPTLMLKNDTGRVHYDPDKHAFVPDPGLDRDGITNDGTLTVNGLKDDPSWTYSVDGGLSWQTGVGNEIAASEMGPDGRKTVLTKQLVTQTTDSGISAFSFVLDTHVSDIIPRLKTVDSTDAQGRPQTGHPVVVFDGYEEGARTYLTLDLPDHDTRPEIVIGGELTLDLQPGFHRLFEANQTDLAGNQSEHHGSLDFVVVPPVLP